MNIKANCLKCSSEIHFIPPDKCFKCLTPVMIEMKRQDKWRSRKRFAYHMLLYVPLTVALGFAFGLPINIAFVAGTIYMSLLPAVVDWLSIRF